VKTAVEATAAAELARASRLERMAQDLMIEAREIRSQYAKPRVKKQRRSLVALAKSMGEGR